MAMRAELLYEFRADEPTSANHYDLHIVPSFHFRPRHSSRRSYLRASQVLEPFRQRSYAAARNIKRAEQLDQSICTVGPAPARGTAATSAPVTDTVWISVNWTSPVPGGRSTIRYSSWPHWTLRRNCWITLCSMGPRQIIGRSPGLSRPMEIIFSP